MTYPRVFDAIDTLAVINAEREAARPIVDELRVRSMDFVWDHETPSAWHTAGFVEELTKGALNGHEMQPGVSLALAHLALAIVTSIPDTAYPPPVKTRLIGNAWKEIGRAHYHKSEYDECLRAYGSATRAYRQEAALFHEELSIVIPHAGVLAVTGHSHEALELLAAAGPALSGFGDKNRASMVEMLRGIVEHARGNFHAARTIYENLAADRTEEFNSRHTVAALWMNLGQVYNALGEFDRALDQYERARPIFVELCQPAEVDRTDHGIANVQINLRNFTEGISILRRVRAAFLEREMPREAGHAGLDMVDGLVALGRQSEAVRLLEEIVEEFGRAKLGTHAMTALAYLRDLISTAPDPRKVVKHVRAFLGQSRNGPARLFLPLPPDDLPNTKRS